MEGKDLEAQIKELQPGPTRQGAGKSTHFVREWVRVLFSLDTWWGAEIKETLRFQRGFRGLRLW